MTKLAFFEKFWRQRRKNVSEGVTKNHFRICAKENPGKEIGFQKTTKNDFFKKAGGAKEGEEKKKGIRIKVTPIDIEGMPKRRRSPTNL